MTNLVGQSLGRYHIIEQIGEGGMAIVYKAFDTRLEREVAVKVIRMGRLAPDIADKALKRFEREGKALARLNHPNIISIIDYGEDMGHPYLVMPYLPGGTLKEMLRAEGKTDWQDAARMLLPIAKALTYAHEEEMIHRDVKPANILITRSGDPMLTDFGIAKIIDEEATMDLTGTRATVGTPEYMAPEQIMAKTVDHRADIYALGIVFYEMVTGRKPFRADTPMAVLFKHASDPLPRPTQFVPTLPKAVEQILLKVLAKDPANRYQSMAAFANALANPDLAILKMPSKQRGRWPSIFLTKAIKPQRIIIGIIFLSIFAFFISRGSISSLGKEEAQLESQSDVVEATHVGIEEQGTPMPYPSATAEYLDASPVDTGTQEEVISPTETSEITTASNLYDDFSDPSFDGYFDNKRWSTFRESPTNSAIVEQRDGALVISEDTISDGYGVILNLTDWNKRTFSLFEAKVMVSTADNDGNISLNVGSADISGGWLELGVGNDGGAMVITVSVGNQSLTRMNGEVGTWYELQIIYNQISHRLSCFVDGREVASYKIESVPATKLAPSIQYWHPQHGSGITVYVDDVIIE